MKYQQFTGQTLPSVLRLTLSLLAANTLVLVLSLRFQRFYHFLNASWKSCSVRYPARPAFLLGSSQPFQTGGLSTWSSVGEAEKSRWGPQIRRGLVGNNSHAHCEQRSVRRVVVVVQQPVLSSPEFKATYSNVYMQPPQNIRVSNASLWNIMRNIVCLWRFKIFEIRIQ